MSGVEKPTALGVAVFDTARFATDIILSSVPPEGAEARNRTGPSTPRFGSVAAIVA
jgi:hypothetical protein